MTSKAKATELVARDAQKDVRAGGMLTDARGRPVTDAGGRPVFASADGAEVLDSLGTEPIGPTTATGTTEPASPGTEAAALTTTATGTTEPVATGTEPTALTTT